jgi:hypothetical protein
MEDQENSKLQTPNFKEAPNSEFQGTLERFPESRFI